MEPAEEPADARLPGLSEYQPDEKRRRVGEGDGTFATGPTDVDNVDDSSRLDSNRPASADESPQKITEDPFDTSSESESVGDEPRGGGGGGGHDDQMSELMAWIVQEREDGTDPIDVLASEPFGVNRAMLEGLRDSGEYSTERFWIIVHQMLQRLQSGMFRRIRERPPITNLEEVAAAIAKAQNILVLTGAGVSTSCGIPDFRSANGVYARLKTDYPTLPDPQAMFSMDYFTKDPKPFFDFAQEIYPGNFKPAPSHYFIQQIEAHGKLMRNYTQNIDTLEQVAGISKIVQCHGSFNTASCLVCKHTVTGASIKEEVMARQVPLCQQPSCAEKVEQYKKAELAAAAAAAAAAAVAAAALSAEVHGANAEEAVSAPASSVAPSSAAISDAQEASFPANVVAELDADTEASKAELADNGAAEGSGDEGSGDGGARVNGTEDAGSDDDGENPANAYLRKMAGLYHPPVYDPVIKPDIVFFGQNLPEDFYDALEKDCEICDLVIVIGSSLRVSPVAEITQMIRNQDAPQILINREPLPHKRFNAELLGDCDGVLQELAQHLGWKLTPDGGAAEAPAPMAEVAAKKADAGAPAAGAVPGDGPALPGPNADAEADADDAAEPGESGPPPPEPRVGLTSNYAFHAPNKFVFPGAVLEAPVMSGSEGEDSDDDDDDMAEQLVAEMSDDAIIALCKRNGEPDWTATMVRTTASDGRDFRRKILQWWRQDAPDAEPAEPDGAPVLPPTDVRIPIQIVPPEEAAA